MQDMAALGDGIWSVRRTIRISKWPAYMSSHMTVIQLGGSDLLLHSPVPLAPEDVQALNQLGRVRFIVAPNLYHYMFVEQARGSFPDAQVWVAPGLEAKLPVLRSRELHDDEPIAPSVLLQMRVPGHASNETAFLHVASRTLILTDLAYNVGKEAGLFETAWYWAHGAYRRRAVPRYHRRLITDRARFREALETLLDWDFEQLGVGHGTVLRSEGKRALREMWRFVLSDTDA